MKIALALFFALLSHATFANVQHLEKAPKICYLFKSGKLTHKTACHATGDRGGSSIFMLNDVTFTAKAFGEINITNTLHHHTITTTLNGKPAKTGYRTAKTHLPLNDKTALSLAERNKDVLQCIATDDGMELCTTDLLHF